SHASLPDPPSLPDALPICERGLSTTLLEDVLGEAGLRALNLANPAGALRAVRDYGQGNSTRATGAPELVELFVLREPATRARWRSEEHTSELQSRFDIVCR